MISALLFSLLFNVSAAQSDALTFEIIVDAPPEKGVVVVDDE